LSFFENTLTIKSCGSSLLRRGEILY